MECTKHRDHALVSQHTESITDPQQIITDPQKNVLWLGLKPDWNVPSTCDIGDGFAAALAKSPLQSTVGHSLRSRGCSALAQAERIVKEPSSLTQREGVAAYGLVMSTSIFDSSANFHLETWVESLRCWAMSCNLSEQVLNQEQIGWIQAQAPGICHQLFLCPLGWLQISPQHLWVDNFFLLLFGNIY